MESCLITVTACLPSAYAAIKYFVPQSVQHKVSTFLSKLAKPFTSTSKGSRQLDSGNNSEFRNIKSNSWDLTASRATNSISTQQESKSASPDLESGISPLTSPGLIYSREASREG